MNSLLRNLLAPVAGFIAGSMVNMLLVNTGPMVVPLPAGADVSSLEGLRESMKLFRPANFLFPFLGHALGTLAGAFVAAKLAAAHKQKFALAVGVLFLLGGAAMIKLIGGPTWFNVTDLVLAYLPMAWIGGRLAQRSARPANPPTAAA